MYSSGAFSEVKLAEHRETKKLVAIKCIPVRITISFILALFWRPFFLSAFLIAFASQWMFSHFDGDCCPLTFGYFRTFDLRVKLYFDWSDWWIVKQMVPNDSLMGHWLAVSLKKPVWNISLRIFRAPKSMKISSIHRKNGDLVDSDSKPNYFILTVRLFAFSIKAFHQLLYYYRTHSNINQRQSTFLNCPFTLVYYNIRR